jgi:hypothetical protein
MRVRCTCAFLPFDRMYWDPNLQLILFSEEPTVPQLPGEQPPQLLAMQIAVSVSVVVVAVGGVAAVFATRRRWLSIRMNSSRVASLMQKHSDNASSAQQEAAAPNGSNGAATGSDGQWTRVTRPVSST